MERNEDLRRATVSGFSGLQRRRQGTAAFRDSREEDWQMALQEMMPLRDREPLQKKDRDREFSKRRRVDRQQRTGGGGGEFCRKNESTESSDEEYYEEEDDALRIHRRNQINQSMPPPSIRSNKRLSLRKLRSSPVLRVAIDETFGVPIPRRARSTSNRRLHGSWSSGSGGFGEDFDRRRFSTYPATESPVELVGSSPSSSGGSSMKKNMKSVEPMTRTLNSASNSMPCAVIQDDIEFEVAEALFDLMKQSQSSKNIELKKLKAGSGRDENGAFSAQNERTIEVDAEPLTVDPMEKLETEENIEIEKFPDDQVQELLCGDEFLSKGEVVSPRESESPSSVKVNACKFQDPTVSKADSETILVETKKESKLEIDLMAPLTLSSSHEKDLLVNTASNPKVMIQEVQEKRETILKNGPSAVSMGLLDEISGTTNSSQWPNLDVEMYAHDAFVSDGSKQQQWGLKEQKNISSNSLVPFPIPMNGRPGVLPHPGYMTPPQAVLPMDASPRSSIAVQPPEFKFSQPRSKRCTTHQHIALNIRSHQQLFKKSWSVPTGSTNFFGTKQLNLNSKSAEQKVVSENLLLGHCNRKQNLANHSGGSGKDKSSEVAIAMNISMSNKDVPQHAVDQAPAQKYLHGPALIFPLCQHQTTSGPPQSGSTVGEASVPSDSALNLCLPAMSFNHLNMPTNETAAPYMTVLQKNGSPFPIPTNMALQKNGSQVPVVPFFNHSFYSSHVFNQGQQHLPLPHALVQSTSQNTSTSSGSSRKPPLGQNQTSANMNDFKSNADVSRNSVMSSNGQLFSIPVPPMKAVGPKNNDPQQKGTMGRVDLIPQELAISFGSNPAVNFRTLSDMTRNGHQKNFQASEGQRAVGSTNLQDGLKGIFVKSKDNGAQSLNINKSGCSDLPAVSTEGDSMFNGLVRNINTVPSALSGKQAHSSQSGSSVTIPNLHQQHRQLIQLQKHHMQQLNGVKDCMPGSVLNVSFPSNNAVFMQADTESYTPQGENFPQQLKSSQGQTHKSFGNMPVSSSFQGQHMGSPSNNSSISKNMVGGLRNGSVPSLQADVSSIGSTQKSSPSCRRNVPSIMSTCASLPSELKY